MPYPLKKEYLQLDEGFSFSHSTKRVYPNYTDNYNDELALRWVLASGVPLVVGSSEMSGTSSQAIPYNFFSDRQIPCFGLGHEGNQLMSILVQLTAFQEELQSSRLTVILSPGWFEGDMSRGTSLQSFMEHGDEHVLYYLWYDNKIPKEIKNHIYDYIVRHYNSIDNPSAVLRAMYYQRCAEVYPFLQAFYRPFKFMHENYMDEKRVVMSDHAFSSKPFTRPQRSEGPSNRLTTHQKLANWDSLYKDALQKFQSISTNNPYGIENNYYDTWMRGKDLKKLAIVPDEKNQELKDLYVLLTFLKQQNCRTLFVMQPLNPLAVSNIKELDPVLKKVADAVKSFGFEYLNLHTSDRNKYEKGILTDYQHLGEAGWYLVDKKMEEYFLFSEYKPGYEKK